MVTWIVPFVAPMLVFTTFVEPLRKTAHASDRDRGARLRHLRGRDRHNARGGDVALDDDVVEQDAPEGGLFVARLSSVALGTA